MKKVYPILVMLGIILTSLNAADFPDIKGWKRVSEAKTYNPGNLWEYINGAAEQFLAYDFQILHLCELSSKGLTVTVNIYDMGTRLNAFGIYDSERPDESEKIAIGAEAVILPPYQCLLLKDAYYVKVDVYEGEITESVGKDLLKAIAEALSGAEEYPEELERLPPEGKVAGSEGYIREGYLGMADLRNCVYAKYLEKKKQEYQVFHMIPEPGKSNEVVWKNLTLKWKSKKHEKHTVLYKIIPYKGLVGIMLTDRGIFGVSDSADEKQMLKRLENLIK